MFAMYDDDGLRFRSTIDKLYTVHEVSPSKVVKNKTSEEQDDDERKQKRESFKESFFNGDITHEAKNAYKQIANLSTKHEIHHVSEIMNRHVITVDDNTTIEECYDIMEEYNVQQLPIRADNQVHLKGMITKHDILRLLVEDLDFVSSTMKKHINDLTINQIITTDPVSDIRRVSKVMTDFNLNAIPVVNSDDILVGMVTRNDILKAVSNIPDLQIWA